MSAPAPPIQQDIHSTKGVFTQPGSVLGSVLGAIFVTALPVVIRLIVESFGGLIWDAGALSAVAASLRLVIFGSLIIFFLVVEPEGLARLWRNIRNYFRVWPFSH